MHYLVSCVRARVATLCTTERGASAVEYGLLVALIAVAIILAVTTLGGTLSSIFSNTAGSISK